MPYHAQQQHFEIAYRTGADVWTHKPYRSKVLEYVAKIPKGGFILDLGTGRGLWPFTLVDLGFRVIGIDYVEHLMKTNNHEVKLRGLEKQMRFIKGDVFDIPFADCSFDVVTDFGLAQHLRSGDFPTYRREVMRVVKPGGYILNVSLSRRTPRFQNFSPIESASGEFQVDGVHYHFFGDTEVQELYGENTTHLIAQDHIALPADHGGETLVITLLQKI